MPYSRRGFTLMELMIVIAIIGLLSTIAIMSLANTRGQSRDARRTSDIKTIQGALELYHNDNGGYPVNLKGECLRGSGGTGELLKESGIAIVVIPEDPIWSAYEPSLFGDNVKENYPIGGSSDYCYWYYGQSDSYYLSYYLETNSRAGVPGIYVLSINN